MEKAVRLPSLLILITVVIAALACGNKPTLVTQTYFVSGNWQITLNPAASPALLFTGFLSQTGHAVNGNLILASNCPGVGPIAGTVDGQSVSLNIDQFGDTVSLTGTGATGAPLTGNFTSQSGKCLSPSSGTWSAVQVMPISGSFHGSFTSLLGNGSVPVTGTLNQGPNTGNSTATLSGTLTPTGATAFCTYIPPSTISGLISGTDVQLSLYGANGADYAQLGSVSYNPTVTVSADGSSISGSYNFPAISASCGPDSGTFQLSFK